MALDWLIGTNLPQFWKNYLAHFEKEEKQEVHKRYVVFDMETTGLNWREDVILSIGAIGINDNAIEIRDFFEIFIRQEKFNPQSIAFSGVFKDEEEKYVEAEAMIQFLNFIQDATLVSHNINLDIEMINLALKRLELGRLKNAFMDTNALYQRWQHHVEDTQVSLDEVCDALKINKSDRLTASGNAYITALVFLKLKAKLGF
ncbi:PolC-type DNA polymerase III [Flavobacterium beibuense]|uniref:DNA polymerase III epsilon subunit n=1 Tax=Flavobacterium beibuense TaxID=657326 RepID=A0A444WH04_9FLAO|nr:3'-5' exonuclease [Flavobacterium beibuense]RYJ45026.1 DNA polymerase III epsilon subunit [Flavobacterium beibuense]